MKFSDIRCMIEIEVVFFFYVGLSKTCNRKKVDYKIQSTIFVICIEKLIYAF